MKWLWPSWCTICQEKLRNTKKIYWEQLMTWPPLHYWYTVLVLYQHNLRMTVIYVQTIYYVHNNKVALKFQIYFNGNNIYHVSSLRFFRITLCHWMCSCQCQGTTLQCNWIFNNTSVKTPYLCSQFFASKRTASNFMFYIGLPWSFTA